MTRKSKQPATPEFSCSNCKHRFALDDRKDMGECRRYPMVFIPGEDGSEGFWANPPAPSDHLCGEHVIKCNS